jgi:hypothetical protein
MSVAGVRVARSTRTIAVMERQTGLADAREVFRSPARSA